MSKVAKYHCIAMDTNAAIYAREGLEKSGDESEKRGKRVLAFIENQKEKGVQFVFPMIALAEYLKRYSPEEHGDIIEELEKHFQIKPFDMGSISCLSRLWMKSENVKSAREKSNLTKDQFNIDMIIAANSLSANADAILTNNEADFEKMTSGILKVIPISSLQDPVDSSS